MNTRLTIASLFLLALIATSCTDSGYESYDECLLTEMQKCSSNCKREAKNFCENKNGEQYSKAVREIWEQNDIKARERCNELKNDEDIKKLKARPDVWFEGYDQEYSYITICEKLGIDL